METAAEMAKPRVAGEAKRCAEQIRRAGGHPGVHVRGRPAAQSDCGGEVGAVVRIHGDGAAHGLCRRSGADREAQVRRGAERDGLLRRRGAHPHEPRAARDHARGAQLAAHWCAARAGERAASRTHAAQEVRRERRCALECGVNCDQLERVNLLRLYGACTEWSWHLSLVVLCLCLCACRSRFNFTFRRPPRRRQSWWSPCSGSSLVAGAWMP